MNPIIEKVADELDTAANAWALGTDNEQYECPYDVLAHAAIKATLEHYAENVSREMSAAGKIPTREIPLGNGMTTQGFGLGANQDWLFQKMIKQALAEIDA